MVVKVDSFFMEDDTAKIDAALTEIEFTDGSMWPPAPETPAVRHGDDPVAAKMIGVIGEGPTRTPVVACYSFVEKEIVGFQYGIDYLDASGERIASANYGYFGDEALNAKGSACFAGGDAPPVGTVAVKVSMSVVRFKDETVWKPAKD